MKVTYDYYRIFYYVAKYNSFTKAAKVLMNSQPNITRTINNLEEALECRLFFRTRTGVTLTPEGEKLFSHVQIAMEHLQVGEQEIENSKKFVSGVLSIAVSEIALHALLLDVLRDFHKQFPGVHIKMTNYSSPQAVEAVKNGEAALAVVTTPTSSQRNMSELVLLPLKMILVAGPSYLYLKDHKMSLSELVEMPFITLSKHTETHRYMDNFFTSCNVLFNPMIETSTTAQILPLIMNDIGVGILPEVLVKDKLVSGEVVEIHLEEKIPNRFVCLTWDKGRPMSTVAQKFIDFVCEKAAK